VVPVVVTAVAVGECRLAETMKSALAIALASVAVAAVPAAVAAVGLPVMTACTVEQVAAL